MDQGLATLIGLIIAVVGVLGTFVAPRLIASSRIYFEALDLSRIDTDEPTERIKIQVFHDDQPVLDPVFLLTGQITNTGSKDITRAEFIEPTALSLDDDAEILSVDSSAPEGVNVIAEIKNGRCQVSWSILKPGEAIELKIVGRALSKHFDQRETLESVKFLARLRDVKTGLGLKRFLPIAVGFIASLVAIGIFGTMLVAVNTLGRDRWVFRDPKTGIEYTVKETEWPAKEDFEICRIHKGKLSIDCDQITTNEARLKLSSSTRARIGRELGGKVIWASLVVATLYGVTISILVKRTLKLLRRARRRDLTGGLNSNSIGKRKLLRQDKH